MEVEFKVKIQKKDDVFIARGANHKLSNVIVYGSSVSETLSNFLDGLVSYHISKNKLKNMESKLQNEIKVEQNIPLKKMDKKLKSKMLMEVIGNGR